MQFSPISKKSKNVIYRIAQASARVSRRARRPPVEAADDALEPRRGKVAVLAARHDVVHLLQAGDLGLLAQALERVLELLEDRVRDAAVERGALLVVFFEKIEALFGSFDLLRLLRDRVLVRKDFSFCGLYFFAQLVKI